MGCHGDVDSQLQKDCFVSCLKIKQVPGIQQIGTSFLVYFEFVDFSSQFLWLKMLPSFHFGFWTLGIINRSDLSHFLSKCKIACLLFFKEKHV